jgi:hypothetical protein
LVERKKGIEFNSLPLKYQDVTTFAKVIGIRYLWIDSLCILQEGSSDWLREAPQMAEYYGNAFLTISASIAVEKGQRCFSTATSATPTLVIEKGNECFLCCTLQTPLIAQGESTPRSRLDLSRVYAFTKSCVFSGARGHLGVQRSNVV